MKHLLLEYTPLAVTCRPSCRRTLGDLIAGGRRVRGSLWLERRGAYRYLDGMADTIARVPVPPEGLRPGQLGVVVIGRVIIGDVAATLVDLAIRNALRIEEDMVAADGGWLLSPAARSRRQQHDSVAEYERILLGGIAGAEATVSLSALASRLPATLDKVRAAIVRDAVRRGWLRHLHHEERTAQGQDLAVRIRAFQRNLRHLKSAEWPSALTQRLLPYALHFGLADPDSDPLARFARAFSTTFGDLPGWRPPAPTRPPAETTFTIDEPITDGFVLRGAWLTGWY